MAIGVLNIFDATTDDLINGVILLRKIPFYNLDSLQMAVIADCKTFISLSSVQNLLTDIWNGKIVANAGWKAGIKVKKNEIYNQTKYLKKLNTNFFKKFMISCFSFGFFAPYLLFDRREKYSSLVINKKKVFLFHLLLMKILY